ncbi:protein RESTRICTED TEV MOVEMENT 2 [Salvia hispanica]|uniref:protein RESTRICTED TEV MOVEMENT 2 n=1 Tax=Salvia hispanica TaxID=49212 RepID=UPI0020098A0B|nr:protein RESTRICTED TEV MOVEMENT 2 [Salvia hispanica]
MAMSPRGGGAAGSRRGTRPGVVRSVYEDFKPESEWQLDHESHILNIYLPGFMKKQIKVSMEGRNTIRVRGERLVGGNKWSRFLEDFQVPENGEMNSARAKFHGGILSITVPREKVGKEGALPTRKQPSPQKESTPDVRDVNLENIISQTEKKESSDRDAHDRDGDQRGRSFTPMRSTGNITSKNDVKNESSETIEKHVASERLDDKTKEKVHKESTRSSELPEAKTMKLEKNEDTDIPDRHTDNKESYGASKKHKHKKEVKGLNQERQLLVNLGAAMLVIVALTAYTTYNSVYAKDKN